MRVGSVCTGIAGIDLGLLWAGMTTVWMMEADRRRRAWLRRRFPNAKLFGDMRDHDKRNYVDLEPVDLVCGGPPCQPASVAGERKGAGDDRWLWPETVRLMAAKRPAWGLFENPTGFVTLGLDGVLSDLEGLGYACWPVVLPACAVDAPQRRDRLFLLAHAPGGGCDRGPDQQGQRAPGGGRAERDGQGALEHPQGLGRGEGLSEPVLLGRGTAAARPGGPGGHVGDGDAQGPPLPEQRGEPGAPQRGQQSRAAAPERGGAPLRPWADAAWIVGHDGKARRVPAYESGIRLLAHGVPGRVAQIAGFGDAVVPYVAYELGLAIMAAHRGPAESTSSGKETGR
ncbi:putative BsuMI modification methylase subunit YdiP [Fundidesulfovibrio magnetotacticus]|uniref:DNA (cytosine-5-)-methyltransferase n=2 Tax=Fundidesulfovibrio magnetotacticus TaxID=2730080 RepID=A0A6V8LSK7_9BACT|nr:putative BsuMI modification methylase subunit YdiP [Fundidesulfovibrio magnetotacticus]